MKFFEQVFLINLDRRKDRLELATKQLDSVGIKAERISAIDGNLLDPDPKIGNGWNHKGVAGCALSHRSVVEIAKLRGLKNFLVIEDDTIFVKEFNSKLEKYMSQIPYDWDMIYFGGNNLLPLRPFNINVGLSQHTLTTNCYAMKETMYDIVLNEISHNVSMLKKPVDMVYTDLQASGKYKIFSFKPHLVWQDSIFSDIENKSQDLPFLRPAVKKMSLIISSYNQKDRLRYSLLSAIKQKYYNYEVIVADDNSDDGTHKMVREEFPGVTLSINPDTEKGKYTLALNWNNAAKLATGERLIFTNADCILPSGFVEAHADDNMSKDIIFGPNERTDETIEKLLLHNYPSTKELIEDYLKYSKTGVGKDLRHDGSAYTYNFVYNFYYPWGNNFSVPTDKFIEVGGFPKFKEYGHEEIILSKKLTLKKGLKVKSNRNALNIHLWHPVNYSTKVKVTEVEHEEYLNS